MAFFVAAWSIHVEGWKLVCATDFLHNNYGSPFRRQISEFILGGAVLTSASSMAARNNRHTIIVFLGFVWGLIYLVLSIGHEFTVHRVVFELTKAQFFIKLHDLLPHFFEQGQ